MEAYFFYENFYKSLLKNPPFIHSTLDCVRMGIKVYEEIVGHMECLEIFKAEYFCMFKVSKSVKHFILPSEDKKPEIWDVLFCFFMLPECYISSEARIQR